MPIVCGPDTVPAWVVCDQYAAEEKSPSPNFVHLLNESLGNADEEWTGGGATAVKAFESGGWTWVEAFESDAATAEHEQPRVQVKRDGIFPSWNAASLPNMRER